LIAPKNFLTILIATVAVSIVIILNPFSNDDYDFSHFTFDAVYVEDKNSIKITFTDSTAKSSFAILEILGMEKTYHKEFEILGSGFSEIVSLETIPKYGWKTIPITLEITYDDHIVKMKTEIHDTDQPSSEIIFSLGD